MSKHVHKYKVDKSSLFGLHKINAVLNCVGTVGGDPCQDSIVKVLSYGECEQKVSKSGIVTYFWPPK